MSNFSLAANFVGSETNGASENSEVLPFLYVDPPLVQADINETFTIAVKVANLHDATITVQYGAGVIHVPLGNLYGLDIQFGWDPSVIQYVNHTVKIPVETYPDGVLHSPVINITDNVDETASMPGAEPGTMYWLSYTSMNPAEPFNGNGTIFEMTFKVLKASESPLLIRYATLGDENGDPICKVGETWLKPPQNGVFRAPGVPVCSLTRSANIGLVNKIMYFEASVSENLTAIEKYMWYIWDRVDIDLVSQLNPDPIYQENTTEPFFSYNFTTPGEYTVGLRVFDEDVGTSGVVSGLRLQKFKVVNSRDLKATSIEIIGGISYIKPNETLTIDVKVENLGEAPFDFTENCTVAIYFNASVINWSNLGSTTWVKAGEEQVKVSTIEPVTLTFEFNSSRFPVEEKAYYFMLNVTGTEAGYESDLTNNVKVSEEYVVYTLEEFHSVSIDSFEFGYERRTGVYAHPVIQGEEIVFYARIRNDGNVKDSFSWTLYANGTVINSGVITLEARETGEILWRNSTGTKAKPPFNETGLFNLTLKVDIINITGVGDVTSDFLRLVAPPKLTIVVSPENPAVNQTVTLDASQSYHQDPEGTIVMYRWKIEDPDGKVTYLDSGSNLTVISYVFPREGDWTVTLSVEDNFGLKYDYKRSKTSPYQLQVTVTVGGRAGGIPWWMIGLAVVLVIIIVVIAVIIRRRRMESRVSVT